MEKQKFILDATAGFRRMWFNKQHPNCIYLDQRPECEPDIIGDFRNLEQFTDETFRLIVWDPPHIVRAHTCIDNRIGQVADYGALQSETWQNDLKMGFKELWRLLIPYGLLIFKWSNQQKSSDQILRLFSERPLFYQITANQKREKSKTNFQTLWFCFMKIPKEPEKIVVGE